MRYIYLHRQTVRSATQAHARVVELPGAIAAFRRTEFLPFAVRFERAVTFVQAAASFFRIAFAEALTQRRTWRSREGRQEALFSFLHCLISFESFVYAVAPEHDGSNV